MPSRASAQLSNRLRKTLYYGKFSDATLPSFPMNDVAVDILNANTPLSPKKLEHKFATKVARKVKISPCALMMGIIYSERLRRKNPDALKKMSSTDLFLISVMVASKYLYDEGEEEEVFNDEWANAGSYNANEVNKLEMEFLAALDWNLFVDSQEFFNFVNEIESSIAVRQGLSRGWFSYIDMLTLLRNHHYQESLMTAALESVKMILVSSVLYSLSVASFLGAAAVMLQSTKHGGSALNSSCPSSYSSCDLSNLYHRGQAAVSCSCLSDHCSFRRPRSHAPSLDIENPENLDTESMLTVDTITQNSHTDSNSTSHSPQMGNKLPNLQSNYSWSLAPVVLGHCAKEHLNPLHGLLTLLIHS